MIDTVAVLLIEDDSKGETATVQALKSMPGISLNKAFTWSMGIRMMSRKDYAEVVVVDIGLPGMKPGEMVENVCTLAATFPIVVISEAFDFKDRQKCMNAGCVAFLKKGATSQDEMRRAVWKASQQTQRHKIDSEVLKLSTIIPPPMQANGV